MSTTINISDDNEASHNIEKQTTLSFVSNFWCFIARYFEQHEKKVIHSLKVGTSLVIVSLLYLLDPLFKHVGESVVWAIMTVVLIHEFFAGATLSKGLLRAIGTVLGGGFGCLVAFLAEDFGKSGYTTVIGISVFVFGAVATYCRMIPSIKRRYDYGIMIFLLTFSFVAVSGLRSENILELARQRLVTICMGIAVCILTNLLIFPKWAGDELHTLISLRFNKLACCIEECMEAYFGDMENKGQVSINFNGCKSVLNSKSSDESLANFARWEPWHGKYGFFYPWDKYLQIGELLRELASIIVPLQACIKSPLQTSTKLQPSIKETCMKVGLSLGLTMRELGESMLKMRSVKENVLIVPELKSIKLELTILPTLELQATENVEALAIANILFLVMEIVDKIKVLAKEVGELGERADFESK